MNGPKPLTILRVKRKRTDKPADLLIIKEPKRISPLKNSKREHQEQIELSSSTLDALSSPRMYSRATTVSASKAPLEPAEMLKLVQDQLQLESSLAAEGSCPINLELLKDQKPTLYYQTTVDEISKRIDRTLDDERLRELPVLPVVHDVGVKTKSNSLIKSIDSLSIQPKTAMIHRGTTLIEKPLASLYGRYDGCKAGQIPEKRSEKGALTLIDADVDESLSESRNESRNDNSSDAEDDEVFDLYCLSTNAPGSAEDFSKKSFAYVKWDTYLPNNLGLVHEGELDLSDSDAYGSDDEDSNDESFYLNDYPEEEEDFDDEWGAAIANSSDSEASSFGLAEERRRRNQLYRSNQWEGEYHDYECFNYHDFDAKTIKDYSKINGVI